MDILCLMGLFPDEYREEIEKNSKCGMQNAADKLQRSIVDGLDQIDGINIRIANAPYVGAYPRLYRKARIPSFPFRYAAEVEAQNIGFCNIAGIKWVSRYFRIRKFIKKWAEASSDSSKILLVYALTTPFANVAGYIKRKYPHVKVCFVVPDLPDYMNVAEMEKKGLYYFLKSAEIRMIRRCIRHCDGYVFLTDAMKEWFDRPVRYVVVEGMSSQSDALSSDSVKKNRIIYAGGIKAEYGVLDMAKAFRNVCRNDWELVIYGDGADMAALQEIAKECPHIVLKGRVPNGEVISAQREASVLINPRKNQLFAKYSFPSKVIEYMSSGTPMMAYKLDGIPDEYDEYYYLIEDKENGLEDAFERVMSQKPETLAEDGRKAAVFISENKNALAQCSRIVTMLREIVNE